MNYRRLFLFVEGNDDKRFFESKISQEFQKKYDSVKIIPYASLKKDKINNFVRSIKAMDADYIYFSDINDSPCITQKKQKIKKELKNIDQEKIVIVVKEIESWYIAGFIQSENQNFKIQIPANTDNFTKEQFNSLVPSKFDSRIDFMLEVLKFFSISKATKRNKSFQYFIEKYY